MSAFLHKLEDAASMAESVAVKLPQVMHHAREEVIGRWNPNRRHDDPEEKAYDQIREEINESHRFRSFADERGDNFVKWHIDGHDYMYALSEMLDSAKESIFILDWWLTPELYLRRPPAYHQQWRLDRLLQKKARQGVKVYIIVYKEVTQTMSMSSAHTKHALESLHENIAVMRHPDHIGAKDSVEFWSHHEKLVVVDNHRACVGGLDLCFGRWDTHTHPLADVHPTNFDRTLFPGQDYNNARIQDFQQVNNYISNALSILENARMPWHDVHMTMDGPAVLDLVQHFTERWNEVKKRKYKMDERYDWLALPHNIDLAPNEAVANHPFRRHWQEIGRSYRQRFHLSDGEEVEEPYSRPPRGSCRVQVVRSVSDWSHGVLTEHSIQNAYIQMIREATNFIYIENQFFISNTKEGGPVVNLIAKALADRIIQAAQIGAKFKVIIVIPEMPGFSGDVKSQSALKIIMAAQYRTMNRGGSSIYEVIKAAGYEPLDYIRFYHLRAYDRINAPLPSFINKMQEASGIKFHQAQVALSRQWIGDQSDGGEAPPSEVFISIPQETSDGIAVGPQNTAVKTESVPVPKSYEEARDLIKRFERGADQIRGDDEVSDSVTQHMLTDRTGLADEKWLGSAEEELQSFVSELLYIHTKLMIVDDKRVIMGSANINDRSQKGDGDSEIALVVEDNDLVKSTMNGRPFMAARFATTLRRKIFREHLGLIPPQICQEEHEPVTSFMRPAPIPNENEIGSADDDKVADPLSDTMLDLWNDTARKNREIFTEIFRPVPTNLVRDWTGYDKYVVKVKAGHVAPDVPLERVKERLSQVKGALVDCPLDFLIDQNNLVENTDWSGLNPTLPVYI